MRLPLFIALTTLVAANAHAAPAALGLSGAMPDLKGVQIESQNVYDYTFSTAPVDWVTQAGVWEMTNRWSCSPGWSWFGGRSDEVASVWNKRRLGGDQSAQLYFAWKMGLSGGGWPEYPSDAALTICGDGQDLGSGYAFIMGADDNTRSVLMKNGKIVAQSDKPEAILPRLTDGNPGNEAMHRRWWLGRVEKIGSEISCYLDDRLVVSWVDPQPIDGGQTAIWTVNNGLMLARVQLYFERELAPLRLAAVPVPATTRKAVPKPGKRAGATRVARVK